MLLLLQHLIWPLLALPQSAPPAFDVVSVKPASPNRPGGRIVVGMTGREGGPGTGDRGRVHYSVISLRYLVIEAFGHPRDLRISGPGFLDDDWFQVDATMPPTTGEAEFQAMMQTMLADRFQLKYHRETKEVTVYSLAAGKNGPRLTPSPELPAGQPPPRQRVSSGEQQVQLVLQQCTMERLANLLASQLDAPVSNDTGITGKYDFTLAFSRSGAEGQADVFAALRELGLQLEARKGEKGTVPILVIDHIARVPIGN